ncbi:hypothetical protein CAPTEDRAFT_223768 [Capitella teleta]|uniref:Uncharacterized protein n=1 Tax=Capitella teleta TaxID=283909 RepID=R7T4D3_CAPTE|nr:hypothetical protein CAPTEDRAFT_223768 [Capitella teleta]|eukprot:ELT87852.1 hypothetical protein CAPTEDRAFT_223768 [Capitella teleta]
MADLQLKHTKNEEYLNHGKIQHDQIKLLYTYVEAITKNRVLKNTTFWQNTTNYLLYIIFVLNAFITGFGIATPSGTESESAVFNISALSQRCTPSMGRVHPGYLTSHYLVTCVTWTILSSEDKYFASFEFAPSVFNGLFQFYSHLVILLGGFRTI